MTDSRTMFRAMVLAAVMVLSVVAGPLAAAGSSTVGNHVGNEVGNEVGNQTGNQGGDTDAEVDPGSAKPMTISWFRDDGDANGPYPVMPTEYEEDTSGITMFTNAEGDADLRVDNATARNPNGQWDMLTLHVEVDALEELDPPTEGADKGLVTQEFIENDAWDVEIEQTNGDKTLDVADNQDGYENPAGVDADVPPVMVFADTEEIDSDFTVGSEPDTGLFVWVDPNRAVLEENGEETSFEPGDEFEAAFEVGSQTDSTAFEMVDGEVEMGDDLEPANTVDGTVSGQTTLAAGTELQVLLERANGETETRTVEVEGNRVLEDSDSASSAKWGWVNASFDFTARENEDFSVDVYAPGPEGGLMDGEPVRNDDDYLTDENRLAVAEGSGTVRDVIDPNYTIGNATISDSKTMTIAYHNPDHETATGVGEQIGDGHASGDPTIAKNTDGHGMFDEMWVHFETTGISEAIAVSPGRSQAEKFENSPLSLNITQVDADGSPKTLDLSENASGVHIFTDNGDSDQRIYNGSEMTGIFFSMLPNEMTYFQDGEPVEPETGERYAATLTVETDEGTQTETTEFEFVEGQTVLANEEPPLRLPQSENANIAFNSTQARGTAMGIRFVAYADNGSVLMEETTGEMGLGGLGPNICCDGPMTNPWGPLTTSVDTSDLPVDTEIMAEARIVADVPDRDVVVVEQVNGTIRAPPEASVSFSDQSGDGESVTVDSLNLSDGGFVSIHTGSANGPTIGNSEYLAEGEHSDVEVTIDEPVSEDTTLYALVTQDSNNNEEFDFPVSDDPYAGDDGEPVSASIQYTVESTPTPTDTTPTPTDTTPTPTDTTPTPTESDGPITPGVTTTTSSDSGPGFGLTVAVVALIAAALVVVRRRD